MLEKLLRYAGELEKLETHKLKKEEYANFMVLESEGVSDGSSPCGRRTSGQLSYSRNLIRCVGLTFVPFLALRFPRPSLAYAAGCVFRTLAKGMVIMLGAGPLPMAKIGMVSYCRWPRPNRCPAHDGPGL